jgi:hypothetical protein
MPYNGAIVRRAVKIVLAYLILNTVAARGEENSPLASVSNLDAAIAEQFSTAIENPPERGPLSVESFKIFPQSPKTAYDADRHLSLLITDVDIVSKVQFSAVFDSLISTFRQAGGDPDETKEMLFHQLWDSENKKPGLIEPTTTPHCDDQTAPGAGDIGSMNGFTFRCPRFEGDLANGVGVPYDAKNNASPFSTDVGDTPFDDANPYAGESARANSYSAVAISNRFDLLSLPTHIAGGKVRYPDCGEIRLIFARNSGVSVGQKNDMMILGDQFKRNLIAFEARIPNPDQTPQDETEFPNGCVPLLEFFRELSDPQLSNADRAELLTPLIFKGDIDRMSNKKPAAFSHLSRPVADFRNFQPDAGQIRTDEFLNKLINVVHPPPPPKSIYDPPGKSTTTNEEIPQDWTLREFRLAKTKSGFLLAVPDTVKSTPGREILAAKGPLPSSGDPTRVLMSAIVSQLPELSGGAASDGAFPNVADVGSITFPKLGQTAATFEGDSSNQDRGDIVAGYKAGMGSVAAFNTPINDALAAINAKLSAGASLSATNMIDRLRTQTCAGCHQFSDTVLKIPLGKNPPDQIFGFDDPGSLGVGAVWPTKACGDILPKTCDSGIDVSQGAGKPTKDTLKPDQHPPMQFTQVSELILTKSVGDNGAGWRYSISTTTECLLNAREIFFRKVLQLVDLKNPAPCAPMP